jgi:hypothetical protein
MHGVKRNGAKDSECMKRVSSTKKTALLAVFLVLYHFQLTITHLGLYEQFLLVVFQRLKALWLFKDGVMCVLEGLYLCTTLRLC